VLLPEQRLIALDDLLAVAELPVASACRDHFCPQAKFPGILAFIRKSPSPMLF
jgi:hypothetical protein